MDTSDTLLPVLIVPVTYDLSKVYTLIFKITSQTIIYGTVFQLFYGTVDEIIGHCRNADSRRYVSLGSRVSCSTSYEHIVTSYDFTMFNRTCFRR